MARGKLTYLITGGAGFIGTNAADYFLSKGENVIIFDNLSRKGTDKNLDWLKSRYNSNLEFIKGNVIHDLSALKQAVERSDRVIHLAGQVAVTTSVINPREDFENNALGTFNMLESIRNSSNKPSLIYSSTNKVYGGMEDLNIIEKNNRYAYERLEKGISEERGLDFHSPYGCSKGCADQYVRDYSRIYGIRSVVFRQSCIYGPRQFGVEDQGWVAWFTIASVLNKKIKICGDGKQVRDVLHVEDLIKGYEMALDNIDKTKGEVFNIGGGYKNQMSLLELLGFLKEYLNKDIPFSYTDWRPGDQKVCVMDISKAKKNLGWEPKIDVKTGVKKLVEWVDQNKEIFENF